MKGYPGMAVSIKCYCSVWFTETSVFKRISWPVLKTSTVSPLLTHYMLVFLGNVLANIWTILMVYLKLSVEIHM